MGNEQNFDGYQQPSPPSPAPSPPQQPRHPQTLSCPEPSGMWPHPFDCAKFIQCAHGRLFEMPCGPGTVFNPNFLVCDWPYNVNCQNGARGNEQDQQGEANINVERIGGENEYEEETTSTTTTTTTTRPPIKATTTKKPYVTMLR